MRQSHGVICGLTRTANVGVVSGMVQADGLKEDEKHQAPETSQADVVDQVEEANFS